MDNLQHCMSLLIFAILLIFANAKNNTGTPSPICKHLNGPNSHWHIYYFCFKWMIMSCKKLHWPVNFIKFLNSHQTIFPFYFSLKYQKTPSSCSVKENVIFLNFWTTKVNDQLIWLRKDHVRLYEKEGLRT